MPIDLGQTGGQRRSRSARSSAGSIDTGRQTQTRQDFAQDVGPVMDGAAKGMAQMASSLSAFFPALEQFSATAHAEEMHKIEVENATEVARIRAEVEANPDGAREAIKTGDYSPFIPNDEMKRRRVIANTFKATAAASMGKQDSLALAEQLRALPMDEDPDALVKGFLKTQTKDSDPIFALSYSQSLMKQMAPHVKAWRAERLAVQQTQALDQVEVATKEAIIDGQVPLTREGYDILLARNIGMLPMSGPDAVLRAKKATEAALIKLAASDDPKAPLALEMMKVPDKDGSSIYDRNKVAYAQAVDAHQKAWKASMSQAENASFNDLVTRANELSKGLQTEDDNWPELIADMISHGTEYGKRGTYNSLINMIPKNLKDAALNSAAFKRMYNGNDAAAGTLNVPAKTINAIINGGPAAFINEAKSRGVPNPEAVGYTRWVHATAEHGGTKELKDALSRQAWNNNNTEERNQALKTIQSLYTATGGIDMSRFVDKRTESLVRGMQYERNAAGGGVKGDQAALDFHKNFTERAKDLPDSDIEGGYIKGLISKSGKTGGTVEFRQSKAINTALGDIEIPKELRVPGMVWGTNNPTVKDLPDGAEDEINRIANMLAIEQRGTARFDMADVYKRATSIYMNSGLRREEVSPDKFMLVKSKAGKSVINPNTGAREQAKPVTTEALQEAKKQLFANKDNARAAAVSELLAGGSDAVVVGEDDLTAAGHGAAVKVPGPDGKYRTAIVRGGQKMLVPTESVQGSEGKFLTMEHRKDGKTLLTAPPRPTEGGAKRIYAGGKGSTLWWTWSEKENGWSLRTGPVTEQKHNEAIGWTDLEVKQRKQNTKLKEVRDLAMAERSGNPSTLRARNTAMSELEMQLGLVAAPEDYEPPVDDWGRQAIRDQKQRVLDALVKKGTLSQEEATKIMGKEYGDTGDDEDWEAFEADIDEGKDKSFKSGLGNLGDNNRPFDKQFMQKATKFIGNHEKYVPYLYDDSRKGAPKWIQGKSKGNPTVGYGFNIDRPDADKLLKQVGSSKKDVMQGGTLSQEQAHRLMELAMQESLNFLKDHFKDVKLERHQWVALSSLAYNSRWKNGRPTLIGPKLTEYIKAGDWENAAKEIKYRSNATKNDGLQIRRNKEAFLFQGGHAGPVPQI